MHSPRTSTRLGVYALLCVIALLPFGASARRMAPPSVAGFRAHEWGVWLVDGGNVTIDDLMRESPLFVHRAGASHTPATPTPNPQPNPPVIVRPPPTVRKPVLFLSANAPLDVTVRVGFRNGAPWLFYPGGTETEVGPHHGLTFTGRVVPNGRTPLAPIPRGHFFKHLRDASRSTFLASNGESERFIFYDGPSEVVRVTARRDATHVRIQAPEGAVETVFVVANGRYQTVVASPQASLSLADLARTGKRTRGLERELSAVLAARGLTRAEVRSLVRTWQDELVNADALHVISLVSPAAYEAALPMTIVPQPSEVVRVGVVIERL